ncbi:endonuclease/exonuclease/phosphatase family protein [Streptomyces xiamenensis]|uniref:endonuclease/exonuclease/phosphatase family protein n=1 Tax=Streptomyces xiamenensis TaxID=408015 RepID=UPI0037D296E3
MPAVVRLLSYNVRSLRDDTAALARVIRACAPDVVAVQEAPRFAGWRRRALRLGRATGLLYVSGGAPTCGTMIMTTLRPTVERVAEVTLPYTPGLHRRGLACAVLRFGAGARLAVVSCHLGLRAEERRRHAPLVRERLAGLGAPAAVLAGDLNEPPRGAAFRYLTRDLTDGWAAAPRGGEHTYPATGAVSRIDAVLATERVTVQECGVPLGHPGVTEHDLRAASDHLPVLATLRVP